MAGPNTRTARRNLEAAEKQAQALQLRKAGASYDTIAEHLGYRGKQGAHKAVMAALRNSVREPAEEYKRLELERLDVAQVALWRQVQAGNLGAIDRLLKIMERRARLLGLDAPTKVAPTDPSGEHAYIGMSDDDLVQHASKIIVSWTSVAPSNPNAE
jgi:hypothetical protein